MYIVLGAEVERGHLCLRETDTVHSLLLLQP